MKAQLTFSLPDEQNEFNIATNGWKWQSVVWDMDQKLRSMYKYEDKHIISIEDARKMILEFMNDSGLRFDE